MPWSYTNIDWNGTGAMVQAVGSVAAIAAAIVIDQGTARRAEKTLRVGDQAASAERRRAIEKTVVALEEAAFEVRFTILPPNAHLALSRGKVRALQAGSTLIAFYLRQTWRGDPRLVVLLAEVQELLTSATELLGRYTRIRASEQEGVGEQLGAFADAARLLLCEYDGAQVAAEHQT